jgi:NAD(P)-dependent dehydrogenase (short-subunit alcohol dehydrogenase family)
MKTTVLITGATSGIGRDAALYLHSRGMRVIAAGRNRQALTELEQQGLHVVRLDVTDSQSIADAKKEVDRITDGYGLDALVNNAGYGLFGPSEMLSDADVRAQFDTNFFGLLAVIREFLPQMRERRSGRIVNVSSVGGRLTLPLAGVYNATKYALESLSDALRIELHQFGVNVSLIEPGYIKTGFTATTVGLMDKYKDPSSPYAHIYAAADGVEQKLERFAAGPRPVAKAIERAITSSWPRARYVAPRINAIGIWFALRTPTFTVDWFMRVASGMNRRIPRGALPSGNRPALTSGPSQHAA